MLPWRLRLDLHEMLAVRILDPVHIKKFPQPVIVQVLPPADLLRVKSACPDHHPRRTGAFPIADQLHHPQGKEHIRQKRI